MKIIKSACIGLILSALAFADGAKTALRLEAVTWNPLDHKLTWTVAKGNVNADGKFESVEKSSYEINMDAATMRVAGKDRRFERAEAVSVHALMDLVAKYAAESTVWWEAGKGQPVDENSPAPDAIPHRSRPRELPQPPPAKVIKIVGQAPVRNPGPLPLELYEF